MGIVAGHYRQDCTERVGAGAIVTWAQSPVTIAWDVPRVVCLARLCPRDSAYGTIVGHCRRRGLRVLAARAPKKFSRLLVVSLGSFLGCQS
ncbi:hypothetical protein L6452_35583 [Arctium lappa]|uniref:Uncharacterized protein n=1 Tax=Arctium lappa TaxID=4217 RepID=A0ACB8Y7D0_ARCLA|nr:hypothetical protein L6452_35583 [Arctium lappa]